MFFFTSSPISRFSAMTVRVYMPGMFDEFCLEKNNDKLKVQLLNISKKQVLACGQAKWNTFKCQLSWKNQHTVRKVRAGHPPLGPVQNDGIDQKCSTSS